MIQKILFTLLLIKVLHQKKKRILYDNYNFLLSFVLLLLSTKFKIYRLCSFTTSFNFYLIYHVNKYFKEQICIEFSRLFVLIKTYEISISIYKYP